MLYINGIDYAPFIAGPLGSERIPKAARVIILPMPNANMLAQEEIAFIDKWVSQHGRGLFLMGFYLGDVHHRSNFNALAHRFNFSFGENLLMPKGATSDRECNHQAMAITDHKLAVRTKVSRHQHAIAESIGNVSFLSACSLKDITFVPEFMVTTPVVSVMQPIARKDDDGFIVKILEWHEEQRARLPVFAAWRHGRGRVVACGTWKICCQRYGSNPRLIINVLEWLRG